MQPEGIRTRIALGNHDEAHARRIVVVQWMAAQPVETFRLRDVIDGVGIYRGKDTALDDLRQITARDLLTVTGGRGSHRWHVERWQRPAIAALEPLWWGLPPRFWAKVAVGPAPSYAPLLGSCWMWTGAMAGPGAEKYGYLRVDGKTIKAATLAYEAMVGPVPDGLHLDHLCRVRGCIRPTHLEPVTVQENMLRGIGPSAVNARKTHCPQGHPYDAENTGLYRGSRYCKECNRTRVRETHRRKAAAARAGKQA